MTKRSFIEQYVIACARKPSYNDITFAVKEALLLWKSIEVESAEMPDDIRNKTIRECQFSVRTNSCLTSKGIKTLGELTNYSERDLLNIHGFGRKSLVDLQQFLFNVGLYLRQDMGDPGQRDVEPTARAILKLIP